MTRFPSKKLTTTQRGYGYRHQLLRKRLEPLVRAGKATCSRCGMPIYASEAWHLDHSDDRLGYLGASHALCNSTAPHARRSRTSRDW